MKKNNDIIVIILVIAVIILGYMAFKPKPVISPTPDQTNTNTDNNNKETYTYKNHGFTLELPKGFVPHEEESEGGPSLSISLPYKNSGIVYVGDTSFWEQYNISAYTYLKDEKIGTETFKVYKYGDETPFYWLKKGKVGYELHGDKSYFSTFKFVGWPQVEGRKDDLVSFSIAPGQEVSGKVKATGSVKGAYFFEANILVNILDGNKKLLKAGHGTATTDWMTTGAVDFTADIDFTGLPKGKAFIEIHNDNPSDLPQNDKSIYIPIIIK